MHHKKLEKVKLRRAMKSAPKNAASFADPSFYDIALDLDAPDHWSTPIGCLEDCPACAYENRHATK